MDMYDAVLKQACLKIRQHNNDYVFLSTNELMALEIAVRHEIPRRPNLRVEHRIHYGGTENVYRCAECGEKLEYAQTYCHECGQHQDWSEEWED